MCMIVAGEEGGDGLTDGLLPLSGPGRVKFELPEWPLSVSPPLDGKLLTLKAPWLRGWRPTYGTFYMHMEYVFNSFTDENPRKKANKKVRCQCLPANVAQTQSLARMQMLVIKLVRRFSKWRTTGHYQQGGYQRFGL